MIDNQHLELTQDRHYAIRNRCRGVRPGVAVIEDASTWFPQRQTWGMRRGPLMATGERWAPPDSRLMPETAGIQEHAVEVRCNGETGYGIFEIPYGT